MSKCAICQSEEYSLKVVVEYEKCQGCSTLICLDCFYEKNCPICKSKVINYVCDKDTNTCNERDEKYGLFECPDCSLKIPRRNYYEHFKTHNCRCLPKCPNVQTECKATVSKCYTFKHSKKCFICKGKYCLLCNNNLNESHEIKDCICGKGKIKLCQNTNKVIIHKNCEQFRYKPFSNKVELKKFCETCGFVSKEELKYLRSHDCNLIKGIISTILQTEQFKQVKEFYNQIKVFENANNPVPNDDSDFSDESDEVDEVAEVDEIAEVAEADEEIFQPNFTSFQFGNNN